VTDPERKAEGRPPPHAGAALAWWVRLTDEKTGDRGVMARLRRANGFAEAWSEAETMSLYRTLGLDARHRSRWVEAVGLLAIVLAHVRENGGGSLGGALGGDPPVLNPLRLRRLTAARDGAELLRGFREVVALLGGRAPVVDLARCVLFWLDEDARDATRTRFLFDYHGAGFAAPQADPTNPDDQTGADDAAEPAEPTR